VCVCVCVCVCGGGWTESLLLGSLELKGCEVHFVGNAGIVYSDVQERD
jgi:hypothetical protein